MGTMDILRSAVMSDGKSDVLSVITLTAMNLTSSLNMLFIGCLHE
jgi:hypothetical protein